MWVFGYGSLTWKADFPYERKLVGYIKGYIRRFYQKSTDHRGTPSKPGRVVTLLPSDDPNDQVWGLAYEIASENVDKVVAHLDFREKGGYERKTVLFYPQSTDDSSEQSFELTIYIGSKDNPNYAGAEDINVIARHILNAHGPSGSNKEYLYKLAYVVRALTPSVYDDHLFSLEAAVRKLEEDTKKED